MPPPEFGLDDLEHDTLEQGTMERRVRLLEAKPRAKAPEKQSQEEIDAARDLRTSMEPTDPKRQALKTAARREGEPWLHQDNPAIWTGAGFDDD